MNLVTGATGIIGSHVVFSLLQNNELVIAGKQKQSDILKVKKLFSYYTKNYQELFDKIKWVEIDLLDIYSIEAALENVNCVYHCAGMVSFNKKDRASLYQINEIGTTNVVNACLNKNINSLCYVSSISTINNLDYKLPLNEDVFWKKSGKESDYSISKYNAEREVWRGIEEGLSAVIVNPGIVLSPGFWNQSSSVLFSTCFKGNKFYTNGSSAYIGALDLSAIMLELVSAKKFGSRYIIIENNYSYHFILSEIQKQLNKTPPSIKISKWQMRLGRLASQFASNFTKNHPLISSSMINSAFNTQTFSNQKILALTKRQIMPINQVINEICKIYLSENQKE